MPASPTEGYTSLLAMSVSQAALQTLHVNTEPTWRGGELQTLLLLRGLRELGHRAHLVCPAGTPLSARAAAEGIEVFNLPLRGEIDVLSAFGLRKLIRRGAYRIIHAHTSHGHTLAALAAMGTKAKVVVSRRVDFSIYRRSFFGLNGLKYRFGCHRIIAVSEAVKRVLVGDGVPPEKITVVHSGVDPARFSLRAPPEPLPADLEIPPDAPLVLNTAHLTPHKGQIHLIRAFPMILQSVPRAYLCIAGTGELADLLNKEVEKLGIAEKVRLPGFRTDVEVLLRNATVFVMSSVEEGLGTAVLDAFLAGVPVVATTAGGLPEMIENRVNGLLVPPADPEALAKAVVQLLRNPRLRLKLAKAGRETVLKRFTYRSTVAGTLRVYEELLEPELNT